MSDEKTEVRRERFSEEVLTRNSQEGKAQLEARFSGVAQNPKYKAHTMYLIGQREVPIESVAESSLDHDESSDDKTEQHRASVRRSLADLGPEMRVPERLEFIQAGLAAPSRMGQPVQCPLTDGT